MKQLLTLVVLWIFPVWAFSDSRQFWTNHFEHAVNVKGRQAKVNSHGVKEAGLQAFLESPLPVAEGDIILNSQGVLVMAHHADDADNPIHPTFKEWFTSIMTSTRRIDSTLYPGFSKKGTKLDIKENAVLNQKLGLPAGAASSRVIQEIQSLLLDPKSGVSRQTLKDRFFMVSGDIVRGPGADEPALTVLDMMTWRTAFPDVRLSIGYEEDANRAPFSRYMIHTQYANASLLGGQIDFNLREPRIRASVRLIREQIRMALNHPSIRSVTVTVWNAPQDGDAVPKSEDIDLYLHGLLPEVIPEGKSAVVLLDLRLLL